MLINVRIQPTNDFRTRLTTAIQQGRIQACFQPIVDAQTQQIVSCEVVPCWHDEIHGHVPARNFMPVAQQLGMLEELGLQVWSHSLACLHAWRSHSKDLTLVANVSRQQLHAHSFTVQLSTDLRRLGIPLSCMDLEIAEDVAMEDSLSALERLTALREAGFGVVIGEFGSGIFPFSQLIGKPSTGIRIDASLTRRVQGKQGVDLVEAIVKVAQVSNLTTIAAGVEDAETAAIMTLLGVHRLQGRHIGEPVDRQGFEKLLAHNECAT
jgi:EAL domain-containing protein (putative c-di-GMP-specific phosphodiesterase class I)